MKTKLSFKGNYQNEFGGLLPRIWKAYSVYNNKNEFVGSIYQEPQDYQKPFRAFKNGFETSGDYYGQFKTKKEALKSFEIL
jgi:hypothetical protein